MPGCAWPARWVLHAGPSANRRRDGRAGAAPGRIWSSARGEPAGIDDSTKQRLEDLFQANAARLGGDVADMRGAAAADGHDADTAPGRARQRLAEWLALARRLPAHDLLDRIDAEGGLAARWASATPQDRRVRANLGSLLQQVLRTE